MSTVLPKRLASLDSNNVLDPLDYLSLPGATFGLRPLWSFPKVAVVRGGRSVADLMHAREFEAIGVEQLK